MYQNEKNMFGAYRACKNHCFLQVIAKNSDWLIALLTPDLIGSSNYCGIGFSTVV